MRCDGFKQDAQRATVSSIRTNMLVCNIWWINPLVASVPTSWRHVETLWGHMTWHLDNFIQLFVLRDDLSITSENFINISSIGKKLRQFLSPGHFPSPLNLQRKFFSWSLWGLTYLWENVEIWYQLAAFVKHLYCFIMLALPPLYQRRSESFWRPGRRIPFGAPPKKKFFLKFTQICEIA